MAGAQRTTVGLSGISDPRKKNGRIFRSARTGVTRQKGRLTSDSLAAPRGMSSICPVQILDRLGQASGKGQADAENARNIKGLLFQRSDRGQLVREPGQGETGC